jgi:cell division protein FtsB
MMIRGDLQAVLEKAIEWLHHSRRRLATCAVGILACLLAYHVVFGANGLVVYKDKREESRQLQQRIRSLQHQNQQLGQQIKALRTDPQAIEKEARERLHYVRPGEVIYTVPTKSATPPTK